MTRNKDNGEPKEKPIISLGGVDGDILWEQIYIPNWDKHFYLVWDSKEGKLFDDSYRAQPPESIVPDSSYHLEYHHSSGKIYKPWDTDLARKGLLYLPSGLEDYGTEEELWQRQREFIYKYCDVKPDDHTINIQYVGLSWIFDRFNEVSYRRFLGDWGTGKSRALQTMGICCYRPVIIKAAATPASIFRTVEQTGGTLLIDEANFDKKGDIWAAILGILNAGYERMGGIIRCGKEDYALQAFQAFGPKILASRVPFPDRALESRCLTCHTFQTHRDIPVNIPPEFFVDALQLRNRWLLWRFHHYHRSINPAPDILKLTHVIPRLRQIIAPLAAVRPHDGFFVRYIQQMHNDLMEERRQSWEGQVLQAITDLRSSPSVTTLDGVAVISVYDIAEQYRLNQGITEPKDFTPHRCGYVIRRLGFETRRQRVGKRNARVLVWAQRVFERRCRDYGVNGELITKVTNVTEVTGKRLIGNTGNPGNIGKQQAEAKTRTKSHSLEQKDRLETLLDLMRECRSDDGGVEFVPLHQRCVEAFGEEYTVTELDADLQHLRSADRIVEVNTGRYRLL